MSQQLINRSPDLKQLWDEGYDVAVRGGHLLVRHVPYVNAQKEIAYGTLVSPLKLAGDVTAPPTGDHVAKWVGTHPCREDGSEIQQIKDSDQKETLDRGLIVQHTFSAKPTTGAYTDYHHKMTSPSSPRPLGSSIRT